MIPNARLGYRIGLVLFTVLYCSPAHTQVRAGFDTGTPGLYRVLQQIQTTGSVMHTGAHPDDEDSALLAFLARREHARTAYLALTRGDGGQNLIGPELSEQLGVIRTEELLQSRKLDGAAQLFTRAVDFGFSEYRSEAARIWNEDVILGDMVRAIRQFRPLVIVSRFTGTPEDGHGHHQYAGYLTPMAMEAAADPHRFPEQLHDGLTPWQVLKLYVTATRREGLPGGELLLIDTGERSPVIGRSYYEIAMEGRSQQKTQQMGSLELPGPQTAALRLVASKLPPAPRESGVFDGIDTTLRGISRYETGASRELQGYLQELQQLAASAVASYKPLAPQDLLPILSRGLTMARRAAAEARQPDSRRLIEQKVSEFEKALQLASGVVVDALADSDTVVAGDTLTVAVSTFSPDAARVRVQSVDLETRENWSIRPGAKDAKAPDCDQCPVEYPQHQSRFAVTVPPDARSTQPYWLERPRHNFEYDWAVAGGAENQPFRPALLTAEVRLSIAGEIIRIRKDVEYRYADGIRGEIRRPVDVVPAVSVTPASELLIVPAAGRDQDYELVFSVSSNSEDTVHGIAAFEVPEDWTVLSDPAPFSLRGKSASSAFRFKVRVPGAAPPGEYDILATARVGDRIYRQSMQVIDYPHIQSHRVYRPSALKAQVLDVKVAPVTVAYIMGSGDRVPDAIRRLGIDVVLLDDEDLATGDLSRFDTIVVGIRASGTRPAFVSNNARLLEFARQGGTLVVQYQQEDYFSRSLPPYPASMVSSVRTVDENAPVTILQPAHPLFNYPNRIGQADFENWVQERNGYTFTDFDSDHYVALLECHDEGEPESIGGMMYAEIGAGRYLYTSYSWFRQLPNGVPGAYRIFANILSLPRSQ